MTAQLSPRQPRKEYRGLQCPRRRAFSRQPTGSGAKPGWWSRVSSRRVILSSAQIVPIRRCNLACTYCNEFDDHAAPVPTDMMLERIDHLTRLGTANIEISGGEPLLHPDLDDIIRRIRHNGALAGLITNGYLLNEKRIARFNDAGLDHLQISVDNVTPDDTSKKSLKVLDTKLQMLARHATFNVNINSVLGGDLDNPDDALTIARRAIELRLTATVGLIHNGHGRLVPLTPDQYRVYDEITAMTAPFYTVQNQNDFQRNLANGRPNQWQCGAGGRYLYICEDGLVHWCSQQRGLPWGSACRLHHGRRRTRTNKREELRAVLHGFVRTPCGPGRPSSRTADGNHQRHATG